MRLSGKVALITGAGSGIGRATALIFAREGAGIVVNDLYLESAREVAAELKANGHSALPVQADVSSPKAVGEMIRQALDEFGKVDILVNNAGHGHGTPFHEMNAEDWDRIFAVHVGGAFNCTRGLIGQMMENKWGRVINMSSVAANGEAGHVHYSAAKAALCGFSKALAKEVGSSGITVNAVAPGLIETPIFQAMGISQEEIEIAFEHYLPLTVVGRIGKPEDIANACLYLASEEASFVTGQVISPNGGYYM
jgi:NAD(P)-dependent dehydrogenase (short-subunit alcohol dehydrogenase family)